MCWKGTTEKNAHGFCLENELATDNYERITIKKPHKNQAFFVAEQDRHFKIECSAIENTSVNQASRAVIERFWLLKRMQHMGFTWVLTKVD